MLKGRSCHAAALQGLRVQPIGSIRGRVACFSPVFLLWCLPLLAASLPPSLLRRPFSCRRFNRKLKKGRRSDANEHFLKDAASAEFAEIPQRRCSFHYFPFHTAGAASGVGGGRPRPSQQSWLLPKATSQSGPSPTHHRSHLWSPSMREKTSSISDDR